MNPIRCFVLDDEAYAAVIIATFIEKTPSLSLVGTSTNVFETLQLVQQGEIDLLFLDIQMPELTGIQVLKIIGNKCKVILTTAYPDYALEGFELDVVDYLMKPISFERFIRAVNKAEKIIQLPTPIIKDSIAEQETFLLLKGDRKNKFHKVLINDILFIEGLKNYVYIQTTIENIIIYQNLQYLEDNLPCPPFFRIHRSYIVSLNKIQLIDGNSISINKQLIPIGENYRKAFFDYINNRQV